MDLSPGAVIAGRYRVDKRVGAGGMGEVWSGEHVAIGVKVAIKTLLPAAKVSHEVVARFKREAYLLGRIRSDYVARVLDFVTDDEFGLVIVMEFIEGDSLAKVLGFKRLGLEETIELGADVASALCDLHRAHVVHRDLKPGNIILQPLHGGRKRAVVVDFGVSRMISAGDDEDTITGITRANMAVGTVEYMAPEQILNSRDVTGGSDCYALGAILFRAVAGHHVYGDCFDNELAHTKLTKDAPALELPRSDRIANGLKAVVARALRRRPGERYPNADEMLRELGALRDLVRASTVELSDSMATTLDGPAVDVGGDSSPASEPASSRVSAPASSPVSTPGPVSSQTGPSGEVPARASSLSASTAMSTSEAVPVTRGVSRGLVAASVLAALVGGAVSGAMLTQRRLAAGGAESTALASPAQTSELAPPSLAPVPPPSAPGATAEIQPPTPEIDLGELDPTPRQRPRAAGSAAGAASAPWIPPIDKATGAVVPSTQPSAAPKPAGPPGKPIGPKVEKIDF
jgi:serine/threonine-protein kinase